MQCTMYVPCVVEMHYFRLPVINESYEKQIKNARVDWSKHVGTAQTCYV